MRPAIPQSPTRADEIVATVGWVTAVAAPIACAGYRLPDDLVAHAGERAAGHRPVGVVRPAGDALRGPGPDRSARPARPPAAGAARPAHRRAGADDGCDRRGHHAVGVRVVRAIAGAGRGRVISIGGG